MDRDQIIAPIRSDLEAFEKGFIDIPQTDIELLDSVITYVVKHRGKRMRPTLIFLVARMLGNMDKIGMEAARIIELIHTATLIHDDVVDESDMRRGAPSVNNLWNNKISILVGDFLFSQALIKMMNLNCPPINHIIANVTTSLSKGELSQIQQSQDFQLNEENYFQIITNKTASLIAASCQIGAIVGGNYSNNNNEMYWELGKNMGCAFQIQDDLLDYIGDKQVTGKPVGNDIKENKITLPLIYAINKNGNFPAEKLRKLISQEKDDALVDEVINLVTETGGTEYARQKANEFVERAIKILLPFEDNIYKRSLEGLVQFAAVRDK